MRANERRKAEQQSRRRGEEDTRAERSRNGRAARGRGDDAGGAARLRSASISRQPAAGVEDDRLVPRVDRRDARRGHARRAAQGAAMDGEHCDAVRALTHVAYDAAPAAEPADSEAHAVVKPVAPDRIVGAENALVVGPHRPLSITSAYDVATRTASA